MEENRRLMEQSGIMERVRDTHLSMIGSNKERYMESLRMLDGQIQRVQEQIWDLMWAEEE
jgi:hypothetical protein